MRVALAVVGGGVWGVTAALVAARSLRSGVWLLEAGGGVAQESSAKSGGILTDLLWHPEDQAWVSRSRHWYREAQHQAQDPGLVRSVGMLSLAKGSQVAGLHSKQKELKARDVPAEILDAPAIRRRFPQLDGVGEGVEALWTPHDWVVNPTAYAQAILQMAKEVGLTVKTGWKAKTIHVEDAYVTVESEHESIQAERVLVAAGTWTRKLVQTAGFDLPLRPYRTQLSSFHFSQDHSLPIVWDTVTDRYIVPDGAHSVLVGDGTDLREFDPDSYPTSGDAQFEMEAAQHIMDLTSLAHTAALRSSWAGLCGATPDRRPLLGPVADRLLVACGDNGIGVMRGPALGELAARIALGEPAPAHLRPHRYPPEPFPIQPGFTLT